MDKTALPCGRNAPGALQEIAAQRFDLLKYPERGALRCGAPASRVYLHLQLSIEVVGKQPRGVTTCRRPVGFTSDGLFSSLRVAVMYLPALITLL